MATHLKVPVTRGLRRCLAAGLVAATMTAAGAAPAWADFCIQLNGGAFSGDIGFFRFKGSLPTEAKAIAPLAGRAAGLSPAYGTAVVGKDGTYTELGVSFFIDGVQGQFDVAFSPPTAKKGSGAASFGEYGLADDVKAKIVSCSLEP
jgi:hypothetical protein